MLEVGQQSAQPGGTKHAARNCQNLDAGSVENRECGASREKGHHVAGNGMICPWSPGGERWRFVWPHGVSASIAKLPIRAPRGVSECPPMLRRALRDKFRNQRPPQEERDAKTH